MQFSEEKIWTLANNIRTAIIEAKNDGILQWEPGFKHFPLGCCGDTSEILASYLSGFGIHTMYACGNNGKRTHAWLIVDDERLQGYPRLKKKTIRNRTPYTLKALKRGLYIDITSDQFGHEAVYVGPHNDFYEEYHFEKVYCFEKFSANELHSLYHKIAKYL